MFIPLYWGPNVTPSTQFLLVQSSVFLEHIIKKALLKQTETDTEILGVGIEAN